MVLPPPMQSSLPAGWLAFTGRELNPLDRYKRFQIIHPPFLDLAWRKGSFITSLSRKCDASFRLNVGRSDHLAPFLGFCGDELSEVGGRPRSTVAPKSASRVFILGSARAALTSLIELLDDLRGCVLGNAHSIPCARLVARHEIAHGWQVRQRLRACRGGDRQRAQRAGPDVLD